MQIPPAVKNVGTIILKQAVNAILTAAGPVAAWHYNLLDWSDLKHVLVVMGSAVVAREAMYWVPKLAAWASSNGNGGQ